MKITTGAAAAAIAALLIATAPGVSAGADADAHARDREQISQLMWNYNRALDTLNEDAYPLNFAPDGAFGQVKGRDALHKMIVDLRKGNAEREAKGAPKSGGMYHVETNQNLTFSDRNHARLEYYWMTVFAGAAQGEPARIAAVGRGVDDLVRVDGRWLIQQRNVAPKD